MSAPPQGDKPASYNNCFTLINLPGCPWGIVVQQAGPKTVEMKDYNITFAYGKIRRGGTVGGQRSCRICLPTFFVHSSNLLTRIFTIICKFYNRAGHRSHKMDHFFTATLFWLLNNLKGEKRNPVQRTLVEIYIVR